MPRAEPACLDAADKMASMFLEVFADNAFATNCWLLSGAGTDEAVVVDPGFSAGRVHEMLKAAGKNPVAALATHGHHDHVGAAAEFCGDDIPLFIHADDATALSDAKAWGAGHDAPVIPVKDVRTIEDGDVLDFAGFSLQVAHTPGHTPGSVCFMANDFIFAGDLVFRGSIGRSDFPNSSTADMRASLKRFLSWPDSLDVFPGHGPETTVEIERRTNPFLVEL